MEVLALGIQVFVPLLIVTKVGVRELLDVLGIFLIAPLLMEAVKELVKDTPDVLGLELTVVALIIPTLPPALHLTRDVLGQQREIVIIWTPQTKQRAKPKRGVLGILEIVLVMEYARGNMTRVLRAQAHTTLPVLVISAPVILIMVLVRVCGELLVKEPQIANH